MWVISCKYGLFFIIKIIFATKKWVIRQKLYFLGGKWVILDKKIS